MHLFVLPMNKLQPLQYVGFEWSRKVIVRVWLHKTTWVMHMDRENVHDPTEYWMPWTVTARFVAL